MSLERARRLGGRGSYVLQAEIAACHTTAQTWDTTDWSRILRSYDELLALTPSPVVALNRAVAVCMHDGPERGLAAPRNARGAARELPSLLRDARRFPPPAGAGCTRRLPPCARARRQRGRAELPAATNRRGPLKLATTTDGDSRRAWGCGYGPFASSTSRTLRRSASGEMGFSRNAIPESRTPWWVMVSCVYPDM
jgi:hypothetical protein